MTCEEGKSAGQDCNEKSEVFLGTISMLSKKLQEMGEEHDKRMKEFFPYLDINGQ